MVGATFLAKRIKGVRRPAIATLMPGDKGYFMLLDGGANTEVTPELAEALQPDVIIAAPGARPVKPPIPGIDGKNVFSAEYIYTHAQECGEKAVILGAGLVGIELGI